MSTCVKCDQPRMKNRKGKELTMCEAHQKEYWREHKTTGKPSYQAKHPQKTPDVPEGEAEGEKRCVTCGISKPRTLAFFDRNLNAPDGLRGQCIECRRAYQRKRGKKQPQLPPARKPVAPVMTQEEIDAQRVAPPRIAPIAHQVPDRPFTIVLIDPDTNRAVLCDCTPRPLLYQVPEDTEKFSHMLSAAQQRGHIVAWKMSAQKDGE